MWPRDMEHGNMALMVASELPESCSGLLWVRVASGRVPRFMAHCNTVMVPDSPKCCSSAADCPAGVPGRYLPVCWSQGHPPAGL
jgi:hypothetical protein